MVFVEVSMGTIPRTGVIPRSRVHIYIVAYFSVIENITIYTATRGLYQTPIDFPEEVA